MSATIRRLRKERVDADAAALEVAEANLATALARRAAAQRALDEMTREVAVLEDIRNTMAGRLEASRPDLLRLCVAAIPDDILRCIFEVVCTADDNKAPFYLAAVCGQWRQVALAFPLIWSHIYSFPISESHVTAEYHRVVTLLSRSGAAPLNVAILWGLLRNASLPESVVVLNNTLWEIVAHVSRWRTARLVLPEFSDTSALSSLQGPTPLLTELNLCIRYEDTATVIWSGSGYLPFTPVLRSLTIGPVMFCSSHSEFPALTQLHIGEGAFSDESIYDYLTRSPSLVHLELEYTITQAPRARITLSELQSLSLDSKSQRLLWDPASSLLAMPKLSRLSLVCDADDAIIPFLDAVSPTVRTLDLGVPLKERQLSILRHLENLEVLNFSHLPFLPVDCTATFAQLASSDPPIWPRLTSLMRVEYADGLAEYILRLVAARNTPRSARPPGAPDDRMRPFKLREVTFRSFAPSWLMQEVDRLLRL